MAAAMIGILGGTFDPVHFGHLRPALEGLEQLALDELRWVPLSRAVHRPQPIASAAARWAMLQRAIAGEPRFRADDCEIRRAGPSYTVDTLRLLRARLGATCPLCLLVGADALSGFLGWHRPLEILDLAHLAVLRRPPEIGSPEHSRDLAALIRERRAECRADLAAAPGGRLLFVDSTALAISSTRIRDLLAAGRSARFLLPDSVLDLIMAEGWYRAEPALESRVPTSTP